MYKFSRTGRDGEKGRLFIHTAPCHSRPPDNEEQVSEGAEISLLSIWSLCMTVKLDIDTKN